jgi:Nup93/Nic96
VTCLTSTASPPFRDARPVAMEDFDLSEVLAQSRATTARLEAAVTKGGGADSIPRLERALPQIDRDSRRLAPSPAVADPGAGLRLLSGCGINTRRIEVSLQDPALLADARVAALRDTDLDGHYAADHEAAVVSAISAALQHTQNASLAAVSAALEAEWDAAKRDLIALPASALHPRQPRPTSSRTPATAPGGVLASPFRFPEHSVGSAMSPAAHKGAGSSRDTPAARMQQTATSIYDSIVRRAVHARSSPTATICVATELDDALVAALAPRGDIARAPKHVQHLHAVFTALRYMTREADSSSAAVVNATSSAMSLALLPPAEGMFNGLHAPADRRAVTLGAVRYLSLQFREEKMRRELEARPRDAHRGGVPGLIADVRAYCNLTFDRGVPDQLASGPSVGGMPLWPQVYFCLRAGDPVAALEIIDDTLNDGSTTSSSVVLFRDCLSAYIESGDSRIIPDDSLAKLVHDYGMSVSRGLDNYQRVCYVVLSRLDPAAGEKMALRDDDYALLFFSIEDYLWLRLSIARLDGDPAPPGALVIYGLSLQSIQAEIVEFGPAHFDERGDSPVFYALILLLCGDFASAINYLENSARAITEATHIAFVLYHYGMLRPLQQTRPIQHLQELGDASGQGQQQALSAGNANSCLQVAYDELLWRYVAKFTGDDPAAAAVYLFTIRDTVLRNRYLEKLILETRAFTLLLGDGPVTEPGRATGVLEELWPLGGRDASVNGNDWMTMVSCAASAAERRGDRAAAATLYDMTGATNKVADIVTDRLSAELTSRGSPARVQALSDARSYKSRLVARRESLGSSISLRSLGAVITLAEFFDLTWGGEFERAWAVVSGLGIVPLSDDMIGSKVRDVSPSGGAWSAAVCDRVPDVVVGAMECLAGVHGRGGGAGGRSAVRSAAHVLVNFAGLLSNATADMSARLIRLEVLMS